MRIFLLLLLTLVAACGPSKRETILSFYEAQEVRGFFRQDRAPADATFDNDDLAQNFRLTAFEFEDDPFGVGEVQEGPKRRAMIRRWEGDINYLLFAYGRGSDSADGYVGDFVAKMEGLTGRTFREAKRKADRTQNDRSADLMIAVGSDEMFDFLIPEFARADSKRRNAEALRKFAARLDVWHKSTSPCAGWLVWERGDGEAGADVEENSDPPALPGTITFAFVVVRSDLKDIVTQSCIEEEIAQVLGLPNDNDTVRPSLFNDDEEFALLTRHDEMLLQILYDPRLSPGMSPGEAMPIVREIARELTGGS